MQKVSLQTFSNNIKFGINKKQQAQTNTQKPVLVQSAKQEKTLNKTIMTVFTVGVLSVLAGVLLLAKNDKLRLKYSKFINKIFKLNNKKNTKTFNVIPRYLKRAILEKTGINLYIKQCQTTGREINPQVILRKLRNIEGVRIIEEPFVAKPNGAIQNGRKVSVKIKNLLNMTFEVHDYKNKDGSTSWIMRLYDNDLKNSRSYLSAAGAFRHGGDSYLSEFTHINCGNNGRKFVLCQK